MVMKRVLSLKAAKQMDFGLALLVRYSIFIQVDMFLCTLFVSRLYHLERNQNCFIIDRIVNGLWMWNWRRPVNGGRLQAEFNNRLVEIGSLNIEVDSDCVVSSLSSYGSYSVSFVQNHIDNYMLTNSHPSTRCLDIDSILCLFVTSALSPTLTSFSLVLQLPRSGD
ncbi:hypothetical protein Tco_0896942 [Tanacetum coccineum]